MPSVQLTDGSGGGGGWDNSKEAWSSINRLILSVCRTLVDIWEFSHLEDIVGCNEKLKQNAVRHQFLPTRFRIR